VEFGRKRSWPNRGTVPVFAWGTEENQKTLRIAGVLAEIRTENLSNAGVTATPTRSVHVCNCRLTNSYICLKCKHVSNSCVEFHMTSTRVHYFPAPKLTAKKNFVDASILFNTVSLFHCLQFSCFLNLSASTFFCRN
jgi:hypothetical protein